MPPQKNDILQRTLALLVLKTLASNKRMHGYAITTHIQHVSDELLRVEEGSLYPALHRMEQQGWLRSEWGVTEKNRDARFYALTVTLEQARSNLAAVQAQLGEQYPETDREIAVEVMPPKEITVSAVRPSLWLLFGAVSVLLLIACTNIFSGAFANA